MNIILLAACLWLSSRILAHAGWDTASKWLLLVPLLLLFPLHINLLQGQDILVVLLGLLIFLRSLQNEWLWLGGLGLALTTISPHLAIIFCLPWFFSKPKRFYAFALFGGALAVGSVIAIGIEGVQDYLHMLSETAGAKGDTFGVNKILMYSFSSLMLRLWPTMPDSALSLFTWGGYILGIGWLCWIHFKHRLAENRDLLTLAATTIAIGLFFAPHLHSHSLLPLWAVALVWAVNFIHGSGKAPAQAGVWVMFASALMAPIFVASLPFNWIGVFFVLFCAIYLLHQQLPKQAA